MASKKIKTHKTGKTNKSNCIKNSHMQYTQEKIKTQRGFHNKQTFSQWKNQSHYTYTLTHWHTNTLHSKISGLNKPHGSKTCEQSPLDWLLHHKRNNQPTLEIVLKLQEGGNQQVKPGNRCSASSFLLTWPWN